MANEQLGIVAERAANRAKYARFAYVAPQDRPTAPPPPPPPPMPLPAQIVADFDAGMLRQAIADKHNVEYGYVARVLFKARRTRKVLAVSGLTGDQDKLFHVLVECGIPVAQARLAAIQAKP